MKGCFPPIVSTLVSIIVFLKEDTFGLYFNFNCCLPSNKNASSKSAYTSFDNILNGYMSHYQANGVKVTQIVEDPSDFRLVYEPDNPDADENGYVAYPNVDTVTEMTNLIDSSRAYEASVTSFNAAKSMAMKGLELFNS